MSVKIKIPDPRGDGPVEDAGEMRNGQPNIIDYSNKEPLLFGAGENSSHEYPGKIVINNESNYVDREVKHDQTGTGTAATGKSQPLNDITQPTLPTGAPSINLDIQNNKHGDNFNHNLNDKVTVIPPKKQDDNITITPPEARRMTNEEEMSLQPYQEAGWSSGDHPRAGAGSSKGGQFVSKDGGDEGPAAAGGDLSSQIQLKFTTTIQGKTISVNGNQKKLWEKHTSEDQRNDPDFTTDYGKQLMDQAKDQDKPDVKVTPPEPEQKPEEPTAAPGPGDNWEDKINRDIYKDLPADASGTAKERLFPYQDRQKTFAATEEKNAEYAKLSDEIHSKHYYKEQYEDDLKKFQEDPSKFHPSNEDTFKHNIKVGEEEIARLEKERAAIRDKLISKGKFEYKEVQDLLRSKQTYVDDLKRRKEGSGAYWKDQGQISAHDRAVDQYRTGKKEGHFPGSEHDEMLKKRREQNRRDYEIRDKERQEKKDASNEKMKTQSEDAHARLTAAGLDINKETGKFNTNPTDKQYEYPEKIRPDSTAAEQRGFLKNYKQVLQNKTDMLQLRINNDKMNNGYASNYEEADLKEMTWKNSHFVENHSMMGVLAYNDGDKSTFAEYQKRYQNSSPLSKQQVKEIKLYKTGGPRKGGRRAGFVTMGSWDNHGGVSLFFNSKSARSKMEAMGISKTDWLTTADHEFGHADWQGVTDVQGKGQKFNAVSAARESFIADVNDAYDNKDFSLHSYTDTYRNDRREQLLANEAHSKIREFEIDGSLPKKMNTARATISAAEEFGDPTTTLGIEQLVSARGLVTMVSSYEDFRGELKKL